MVGFRLWRRDAVKDTLGGLPLDLARVPDETARLRERVRGAAVGLRYGMRLHTVAVAGGRELPCRDPRGKVSEGGSIRR
jgi:hypothetical protein